MRRTFADPQTQRAEVPQEHCRHAAMTVTGRRSWASKRPASPESSRRYVQPGSRPSTTIRVRLSAGTVR